MGTLQYQEDQRGELEALSALYMRDGEFIQISDDSFKLHIRPEPDEGTDKNYVWCDLSVTYTASYPDELPIWTIENVRGLTENDLEVLNDQISEEMNKLLGYPMIYDIAQFLQQWLIDHNKPCESMHDQMLNRSLDTGNFDEEDSDEEESEEEEKYQGIAERELCASEERTSKEHFEAWAEKFRKEMIERGIWKCSLDIQKRKLSGRKLFERDATLAVKDDEDENIKNADNTFWDNSDVFEKDDGLPSDLE